MDVSSGREVDITGRLIIFSGRLMFISGREVYVCGREDASEFVKVSPIILLIFFSQTQSTGLLTLLACDRKGIRPVKQLGVGLLVVMI